MHRLETFQCHAEPKDYPVFTMTAHPAWIKVQRCYFGVITTNLICVMTGDGTYV